MNTQTSNLQHALLPIYIVKKSANGSTIGRKRIHFQINAGNTYKISYKFFMPRGFHLANNVTPEVNCQLTNGSLNVPEVTFVYVKDGSANQSQTGSVTVKFLDANTGRQISQKNITGYAGQQLDVLQQASVPAGYHLLANQKTNLTIQNQVQTLNLLVRRGQSAPQPAKVQTNEVHPHRHINHDHAASANEQMIQHSIHAYNQQLSHTLLRQVLNHDLNLLRKVVAALAHSAGYRNTEAVKADLKHHKVVGLADNGSGPRNGIYFRGRRYQRTRPVSISEVRDFITCVMDSHAIHGWFVTTSDFNADAQREAHRHHIRMINGRQLADLMVKNGIGTQVRSVYKIAGLDPRFFE